MTLLGGFPRRTPRSVALGEQPIRFDVGGGVSLSALANWQPTPENKPTLLIVHGLTGHARIGYSTGTAEKGLAVGMNTVRLNLRGCGDSEESSPEIYHAGVSGDLIEVLRALKQRGHGDIYVIGFSLGGNVALKMAGELGESVRELTSGLVAISPPIDLAACCDSLNVSPMNRFYQAVFLRSLRRRLRRKHRLHPDRIPIEGLERVKTLREFDDQFTAPLGGYGNADNYYARASSLPLLGAIRIPTLLIHARDDTFVPFADFETPLIEDNPYLALLACEHGGHNSFVGRRGVQNGAAHDLGVFWAENRAVQFCRALASSPT